MKKIVGLFALVLIGAAGLGRLQQRNGHLGIFARLRPFKFIVPPDTARKEVARRFAKTSRRADGYSTWRLSARERPSAFTSLASFQSSLL